ncbi:hypothetical protein AB1Y20_010529 [Prymnesium parvum]|uniref:Uncharacterized protein n=1 Tax=Prymnesium parvum TaxID=97485 RepID=A0AB34IRN0_PRYPA
MSLPRVATLPTRTRPHARSAAAACDGFALQRSGPHGDGLSGQIGSVIFPHAEPAEPPRVRPSAASISSTSVEHPLALVGRLPFEDPRPPAARREIPTLGQAGLAAGRLTRRSMPMGAVLTGAEAAAPPHAAAAAPRHEYKHPSYHIHRSSESAVKDLIYGGAPPPAAPAPAAPPPGGAPAGHPLAEIYGWLRAGITQLPKSADGTTNEHAVRAGLEHAGLHLSVDGFAELLARCDVSAEGFPDFDAFCLCVSRPHREVPQPALPPPPEAAPRELAPAREEAEAQEAGQRTAGDHGETGHQTWRHMQVQDDLENRGPIMAPAPTASREASGRSMLRAPLKSSFPLGLKSSHVPVLGANAAHELYGKKRHVTSCKFTSSFNPDHWY